MVYPQDNLDPLKNLATTIKKEVVIVTTVMSSTPCVKRGAPRQVVFSFNEGTPETRTPAIRGGKGAYLAEMTALGLPVPPGFTVSTTVTRAFSQNGQLPKRVAGQFDRALRKLEHQTGKEFGNPENPLLISVRSGAQASMPGMMDTILNVGLNPSTVAGLARLQGEEFALDAYRRFLVQFGSVVLGVSPDRLEYVIASTQPRWWKRNGRTVTDTLSKTCERLRQVIEFDAKQPIPDEPREQLQLAMSAVMRSWNSERAQAYRQANSLPSWWGTATTVQAMVFGNRSDASGTGVVFSHDVATGQPGLYGEFLPKAQGEDVVAGTHAALPISALAKWNNAAYRNLESLVTQLVNHLSDIVDVEFTIEDGELYLLQVRRAKRSALAAVTYAVHQVWNKSMTREEAVASVSPQDVESVGRQTFDLSLPSIRPHLRGIPASPGAAVGVVVTSSAQAQEWAASGEKVILVARDTTPDDLPGMLCSQALITSTGGPSSHAAIVALEQNLPAVVGVGETLLSQLVAGQLVSVDGTTGVVYNGHVPFTEATLTKEVQLFLRWVKQFKASKPRIGFEWVSTRQSINQWLNDFYLSNLMATASRGSALESAANELRTTIHRNAAEMLAAYLAIAVAGELRYSFEYVRKGLNDTTLNTLETVYGIKPMDRDSAHQSVIEMLQKQHEGTHAEFFRLANEIFSRKGWAPSFGGEAWAKIAQAGFMFLSGEWSHTVFVDHVFDLRHNGGCLFDKHRMISSVDPFETTLKRQLDVKRDVRSVREFAEKMAAVFSGYSPSIGTLYNKGFDTQVW